MVDRGGFSAAARALGLPRQAVHRRVTALERALDMRLLDRTTRQVRPTDAGRRLFEYALRIHDHARSATDAMRRLRSHPAGRLRLTAPQLFGEAVLNNVIARFLSRWPDTQVEAVFSLQAENLLAGDFDLAIRIGQLSNSSLLARRLGWAEMACWAASDYLAGAARLTQPADLRSHAVLHYGHAARDSAVTWTFGDRPAPTEVLLRPRLFSTSAPIVRDAAVAGLGVARLPSFLCRDAMASPALVEVLAEWRPAPAPIHAVYAARVAGNPTLHAFLDTFAEHLGEVAWIGNSATAPK